jgi:hypothetical protein
VARGNFYGDQARTEAQRAIAVSFRLGFQFQQMSLELVVRNSFTAVELRDTAANFCVDGFAVLLKPAILPGGRAGLQGRFQTGMTSEKMISLWAISGFLV